MAKRPEKKKPEAKKATARDGGGAGFARAKNLPASKQPAPKKGGPMHLPANAAPHGDNSHNRDWAGRPPPKKFSMPRK